MISQYKRDNLTALAQVLEDLPEHKRDEHFDMASYVVVGGEPYAYSAMTPVSHARAGAEMNPCGTSACAAGWALVHGIGVETFRIETINDYVERVLAPFGMDYDWLFSDEWQDRDNTALGAAARIRYYLDFGVPEPILWYYSEYDNLLAPYLVLPIEERTANGQ